MVRIRLMNGLSLIPLGNVVSGVTSEDLFKSGVYNLVPLNQVTKDELVRLELAALTREDILLTGVTDEHPIDRTLETNNSDFNGQLFLTSACKKPPRIEEMVLDARLNLPISSFLRGFMVRKTKDSTVVITCGAGSFGSTIAKHLLSQSVGEVRVFSRYEAKKGAMRHTICDPRVRRCFCYDPLLQKAN